MDGVTLRTLGDIMAVLRYTLLRALILVVVGLLAWLAGFRGFWLLLTAFFVSGLVSIFALRGSRDEVSTSLDRRLTTINKRLQQRAAAEDAWNDAQRAADTDVHADVGSTGDAETDAGVAAEADAEADAGVDADPGTGADTERGAPAS
jgi:hypothetical protein